MSTEGSILIGDRSVGPSSPCFVIAEVGLVHDGSLGNAHAYIDAVADTGVDAVKFQTHIASAESTPGEQFRVPMFPQDASRYDYWKRTEFTESEWVALAVHARERGLIFLSTPFSIEAVDLLQRVGMPAWKIGSGDTGNLSMIKHAASTGMPVLLSSGMSTWSELDAAVATAESAGSPAAVFQCTTAYPCPADKVGLNVLSELRARYSGPVGLSDHSGTNFAGLAAAALGANLIEVHVVFSRQCFGPDVSSSLTTSELRDLVTGVRFIERALANPVQKDEVAAEKAELRQLFGRSIVATRDLPAGYMLRRDDIALKKPGTGIPGRRMEEVIGRVLGRPIKADELFQEDHFE